MRKFIHDTHATDTSGRNCQVLKSSVDAAHGADLRAVCLSLGHPRELVAGYRMAGKSADRAVLSGVVLTRGPIGPGRREPRMRWQLRRPAMSLAITGTC
jgi:hypothetical protein